MCRQPPARLLATIWLSIAAKGSVGTGSSLMDRHGPGGAVVVTTGDDPVRVGNDPAVVEEDVDVVFRGEERTNVALQDEVRTVTAFDRLFDFGIDTMGEIRICWHTACCHPGNLAKVVSMRGSRLYSMTTDATLAALTGTGFASTVSRVTGRPRR